MLKTAHRPITHPKDTELAGYLADSLKEERRIRLEEHIAGCAVCIAAIVSAYESAGPCPKKIVFKKKVDEFMKKIRVWPILTFTSFTMSFFAQRYFMQLLVATMLFGIKWAMDSKAIRIMTLIYQARENTTDREKSGLSEETGKRNRRFV